MARNLSKAIRSNRSLKKESKKYELWQKEIGFKRFFVKSWASVNLQNYKALANILRL